MYCMNLLANISGKTRQVIIAYDEHTEDIIATDRWHFRTGPFMHEDLNWSDVVVVGAIPFQINTIILLKSLPFLMK